MLTKKKKLSRKEIKEDKLVSTYYKAYGYFEENRSRVLTAGGALVVIIALVYFYIENRIEDNRIAGTQLARVMNIYDQGSYLEAIEGREGTNIVGLKQIVEDYGSSDNGEIAKIYLANSYNFLGRNEEAMQYYEDYSGGNDIFKATALAGQAEIYEAKKDYEKAADFYLKASRVSNENVLNPDYMLKAGINFMQAGNDEEAKELFEEIKQDYSTSTAFREVDIYLAQIQ
jgi:tetratricopeptide (TPR) repeat protein